MNKKWWHEKVAYQIYPKSFYDSNGDGIGDLQGIISKLDYLEALGVDILWLSPIYSSPLADQGYDISDYYNIDPRFGTMQDMDELIAKAKERNMYIVMDLVVNHCSDEHEWFQEALKDPDGKYGKYFYIEKCEDGKVPCNWRSYFGGSVWEPIPGTDRCYLHMFHKKQPDLNWENPEVREEVCKNVNWWLDKGLGGFRIDAIMNIKKALPFKDYTPDREDGMCPGFTMLHDAKGIGEFLGELRDKTFRKYDAFAVGEVFNEDISEIPDFIGENGYFSSIFDFNETIFGGSDLGWYDATDITPNDYKKCCFESQRRVADVGFLSNVIENHDEPRGVSRYIPAGDCNDTSKKMLGALNFMLKGIPFIYQGQEIGMENTIFHSIDEVDDVSSLEEYRNALDAGLSEADALKVITKYSRDNARTPMQWSPCDHAGFSSSVPWLKANPNYKQLNVQNQAADPTSVLSFYKELIALRKNPDYQETIVYGDFKPYLEDQNNLMAFYRIGTDKQLLVAANYQNQEQNMPLPSLPANILLNNYPAMNHHNLTLTLSPYQLLILEL